MFDYAHFNEVLLGNRSTILSPRVSLGHDASAIQKFEERFDVRYYDDRKEIDSILKAVQADFFYMIKAGSKDGLLANDVCNLVHAVFPSTASDHHGEVYAYISRWLSEECSGGRTPYVPFIVRPIALVGNLRSSLNIPDKAFVLGCHGGPHSFSIPFVQQVVEEALEKRKDLFFVFLNIEPFLNHERIHYLPGSAEMTRKAQYIATCDGMLHARALGESFGLACAEFSIANKPVWTYSHCEQKGHVDILGRKACLYDDATTLLRQIVEANREELRRGYWDMYRVSYSPQAVMEKFKEVFLE